MSTKITLAIQLANAYLQEYTREELYQLAFDTLVTRLEESYSELELLNRWNSLHEQSIPNSDTVPTTEEP